MLLTESLDDPQKAERFAKREKYDRQKTQAFVAVNGKFRHFVQSLFALMNPELEESRKFRAGRDQSHVELLVNSIPRVNVSDQPLEV